MYIIVICIIILLTLGIIEKCRHNRYLDSIRIRVNVNGIRGKSTVTRLITGIMIEAGYKTIGKTTGTAARMIYWFQEEEKPIKRKPQGPNIGEQIGVVKEVSKLGAEALVCECMAVNPEYQDIFQNKMIKANIGVIVNVLEDHMDVMGPTLDQVAQAFTNTIPYNGYLITVDGEYRKYFEEISKERNTKVIIADNSKISREYLESFEYMVFPDNASIALAVSEALGIDKETALRGMKNAHPDPGAMRVTKIGNDEMNCYFVNGFAANDPQSTLNIWDSVCEQKYNTDNTIVVINCRADRVDRTWQFAKDVLPYINIETLVSIGEVTSPIKEMFETGKLSNTNNYLNLEGYSTKEILNKILPLMDNSIVYGIGNIHGAGEPFIHALIEEIEEHRTDLMITEFS
ncbi:poly-gamma-glutamate synthase PgsB [Paraclostridium sordellii]